ncbi:hypothetical protein AVEN_216953-1 [Araneus ventricosus]|uniref:Uncharacterized protein n=1 Tax=Araneus ventricosus TaxID=182803 RepID=A0A4Y2HVC1_ARAVE|nr:hypothetical protein AVEN_216953-1 [Araneus ventricosus]
MIAKKDFLHDGHSQHDASIAQDGGFSRRYSNEDDVTIKMVLTLRRVVRIFSQRRILRRILQNQDVTRNSDSKRRTKTRRDIWSTARLLSSEYLRSAETLRHEALGLFISGNVRDRFSLAARVRDDEDRRTVENSTWTESPQSVVSNTEDGVP